jgi:hypothetical protein
MNMLRSNMGVLTAQGWAMSHECKKGSNVARWSVARDTVLRHLSRYLKGEVL